MKYWISVFVLVASSASAQNAQRIEHYTVPSHEVRTETSRLNCERAQVGRGVGQCLSRTIVHVYNAPERLNKGNYECSVTWELEKDNGKTDFVDITETVTIDLRNGNGRASFDTSKYIGSASDPVHRIYRSTARCYSLSY